MRMTQPTQSALVARRIGKVRVGLFAHRRYAEAHGLPDSLAAMAGHAVIGFDRDTTSLRSLGSAGVPITREMFAFRCDNDLAQLAALRAGYGIGGCQLGIAARDPDLLPVLHDTLMFQLEMWVVMHEDLRASRRVRLLFDHLVASLVEFVGR